MNDKIEPQESINAIQPGYKGSIPSPEQLPPKGQRTWIDHPEQLLYTVNVLKNVSLIAIDAEFTQLRSRTATEATRNGPRLALLQLAIPDHCFVVDALRLHDLSPLQQLVGDSAVTVLLHGAGADLRVMAERGLYVAHYFDLEATCRSIFGQHESSLAAMSLRAFNVRLDKSLQRTDWTRRPLPPAMIAYAARDAEVTLALYFWLQKQYSSILHLHETTDISDPVAAWIEPFLLGSAIQAPETVVAEARTAGSIRSKTQLYNDCRKALTLLHHPLRRSRLLRLIADLSLVQLAPDIIPLLQAETSDERCASVRALGRLGVKSATKDIQPLLHDPVYDVRKAAYSTLQALSTQNARPSNTTASKSADGTRSWSVGSTHEQSEHLAEVDDWKSRLRSIIDVDP